jgi:hypothetical protein
MDKCARCKRDLGLGSVIITKVEGDRVTMVHFFCGTPAEVKAMYGNVHEPVSFPFGEPEREKTKRKE